MFETKFVNSRRYLGIGLDYINKGQTSKNIIRLVGKYNEVDFGGEPNIQD